MYAELLAGEIAARLTLGRGYHPTVSTSERVGGCRAALVLVLRESGRHAPGKKDEADDAGGHVPDHRYGFATLPICRTSRFCSGVSVPCCEPNAWGGGFILLFTPLAPSAANKAGLSRAVNDFSCDRKSEGEVPQGPSVAESVRRRAAKRHRQDIPVASPARRDRRFIPCHGNARIT